MLSQWIIRARKMINLPASLAKIAMNNARNRNYIRMVTNNQRRIYHSIQKPPQTFSTKSPLFRIRILMTSTNQWCIRHALITAVGVSTVKLACCDYLAQTWIEKRQFKDLNLNRLALFTLFGFFYTGLIQYAIFNKIYPYLFRNIQRGMKYTILHTLLDNIVHSPFVYYPIFYVFKGMVYERSMALDVVKASLNQYFFVNFKSDVIILAKIWIPAQAITFSICPMQYRVPWVSFVGFFWTIILSLRRGEKEETETDETLQIEIEDK